MTTQHATTLVLGAAALMVLLQPAHAYLDPGTGSILLQALIGGLAAGLFMIKMQWARIRARFGPRSAGDRDARE